MTLDFIIEDQTGFSEGWPPLSDFYVTQSEYARRSRISRQRVSQLVKRGRLPLLKGPYHRKPLIALRTPGMIVVNVLAHRVNVFAHRLASWRIATRTEHLRSLAAVCPKDYEDYFCKLADWLERMPQIDLLQEATP